MANITVSSDVDTMLQSADNAAILTNTGAAPTVSPIFTGTETSPIQFGTVGPPYVGDGHTKFTNGIRVDDSNIEALSTGTSSGGAVTGQNLTIRGGSTAGDGSTAGNLILAGGQAGKLSGQTVTHGKVQIGDTYTKEVTLQNVSLIKSVESGGAINYDSAEHRFRDGDGNPNDLLIVKKISGKSGGRVGINTDNSDPKCALHVVQNSSDGYPSNEAIRCTGGLRISNWLRLGPYTDSERDAIGLDPPEGLMIYNEEHYEVQVFIGNPSGSGRGSWKAFTLQNVAT